MVQTVTYDVFLDELNEGKITQVEVMDDSIYYNIQGEEFEAEETALFPLFSQDKKWFTKRCVCRTHRW